MSPTLLRDLIFGWPLSSDIDEAKAHEARQIYSGLDSALIKRIITPAAAEVILGCVPNERIVATELYVFQYKTTPSGRNYVVLWHAPHWRESAEYTLTKSEAAQARIAAYERTLHARGRVDRIVAAICRHYTTVKHSELYRLLSNQDSELALQILVAAFEKAAAKSFYEPPDTTT